MWTGRGLTLFTQCQVMFCHCVKIETLGHLFVSAAHTEGWMLFQYQHYVASLRQFVILATYYFCTLNGCCPLCSHTSGMAGKVIRSVHYFCGDWNILKESSMMQILSVHLVMISRGWIFCWFWVKQFDNCWMDCHDGTFMSLRMMEHHHHHQREWTSPHRRLLV